MATERKHILLISYVFPPHYGIGGRRWAKHADALTKLGYTVHVIYAKNPFPTESLWTKLVTSNPNIKLYELNSRFPKVLVLFGHSILEKTIYSFYVRLLPLLTKGSYLDRSIFWKRPMLKKARKIITTNQIKHVICTGAPFGAMYFTTLLRHWFNDIFIVNDLRDPWTWGPNWGFPNLEAKRFKHESHLEHKMLEDSDIITVPTLEMKNDIDKKYPSFASKTYTLLHFFDKSEITVEPKTNSDKVRLIFYGNIYHHIPELIEETAKTIVNYKDKIELDIYTDKWQHKATFKKHNASNVRFFPQLPAEELFKLFKNYDYIFLMIPSVGVNHISTKFYEIIYSRTPFLIFCEPGRGPDFITSNKLGIHVRTNELYKTFDKLVINKEYKEYNSNFNVDAYSLENNAKQITQILEAGNSFNTTPSQIRNVLVTFDYELFLGKRSGSVQNSIIIPTNKILRTLTDCGLRNALFFIDTIYLLNLRKLDNEKAKEDFSKIMLQLVDILQKGHKIYPHLHPHWLDAKYNAELNEWDLSEVHRYRFHSLEENLRDAIFSSSLKLIQEVQERAGVHHDIDCYRAGGWCIQPFIDFKPFFEKYGLKNEFSVLKNFSLNNSFSHYNFETVPSRLIYKFEDNVEESALDGSFTEYAITSIYLPAVIMFLNRLYLRVTRTIGLVNYGDGVSTFRTNDLKPEKISENIYESPKNKEMTSIELMTPLKLGVYKKLIKNNKMVHFISHPKMINDQNLRYFSAFIRSVKKKYIVETDFKKMN